MTSFATLLVGLGQIGLGYDLGLEPDWVGDVLAMRLDLDMLGRAHRSLTTSRAYRLATAVGRLRGRES